MRFAGLLSRWAMGLGLGLALAPGCSGPDTVPPQVYAVCHCAAGDAACRASIEAIGRKAECDKGATLQVLCVGTGCPGAPAPAPDGGAHPAAPRVDGGRP